MFQTPVGFETLKRRRVIVAARARSTSLQLPIWYLIVSLILQETARDCNRKFPRRREKKPPAFLYVVTERARRMIPSGWGRIETRDGQILVYLIKSIKIPLKLLKNCDFNEKCARMQYNKM